MAGHSQFKNIMHRKGAQDAKRAKMFTKVLREIFVAAKVNPDADFNPRLRLAINAAKAVNLPKDKVLNAISKAASNSQESDNFEEVRYEGYGAAGVAIIVEALTDNRNRTASEVRSSFTKFGGNLGESGSVSFMFKRMGMVYYPLASISFDKMFEATIEAGANDCQEVDGFYEISFEPEDLHKGKDYLEDKYGPPESASLIWKPNSLQKISLEDGEKLLKMLDALEDCDDVQSVTGNFELPDELLSKISQQ